MEIIKAKIKALIFWQTALGEIFNKFYDLRIFYKYSFRKDKSKSKESDKAFLTKQYHIIEKGLALPSPRLKFGREKIQILLQRSKEYLNEHGDDDLIYSIKSCLAEYIQFNKENGVHIEGDFFESILNFIKGDLFMTKGGTKLIIKSELRKITSLPFESFVKSRFSVRDFSEDDLKVDNILKAIDIAKHAPSVCNRQSWFAHVYTKEDQILQLLKLQGGNNGFTTSINKLLIITTDTKAFTTLESNQVYVDGGIFSMNLVLALHSQNIGACCLNTCFPYIREKKVKKVGSIAENEKVIMMMGIGNLKDTYKVALSKKKSLSEISQVH